jgi:glyoxylate reductase
MTKAKPLALLLDPIHPHLQKRLRSHCRVTQDLSRLHEAEVLVCLLSHTIDRKLLKRAYHLKVVANYAVGLNNIDLKECARRKIRVCNTPGVLTRATAELTLALLLAAARRFPEGEALCRSGRFRGWAPDLLLGHELQGRHAVLLGQGRIGRETARLFRALGMSTEFVTRRDGARTISRKLRRAQVLSLHAPLTHQTQHWLSKARIGLLPKDAIVLNTARGALIDERALAQALRARKIFAAGLDVFEREPKIERALLKCKNAVLLPHLGSATERTREAMANALADGILQAL